MSIHSIIYMKEIFKIIILTIYKYFQILCDTELD